MPAQTRQLCPLLLALALSACAVYRPEVTQGNFIDEPSVKQVVPGMSREQVRFLLGPPMIADAWHRSRWDYMLTLETKRTGSNALRNHYIVTFDGDVVAKIEHVSD